MGCFPSVLWTDWNCETSCCLLTLPNSTLKIWACVNVEIWLGKLSQWKNWCHSLNPEFFALFARRVVINLRAILLSIAILRWTLEMTISSVLGKSSPLPILHALSLLFAKKYVLFLYPFPVSFRLNYFCRWAYLIVESFNDRHQLSDCSKVSFPLIPITCYVALNLTSRSLIRVF